MTTTTTSTSTSVIQYKLTVRDREFMKKRKRPNVRVYDYKIIQQGSRSRKKKVMACSDCDVNPSQITSRCMKCAYIFYTCQECLPRRTRHMCHDCCPKCKECQLYNDGHQHCTICMHVYRYKDCDMSGTMFRLVYEATKGNICLKCIPSQLSIGRQAVYRQELDQHLIPDLTSIVCDYLR